jgi:hypothetical protein
MNVKLSPRALRVRIDRAELDTLLASRAITLEVALPRHHAFRINVRPAVIGGWSLDSDPTGTWIVIPRAELEALAESLPSREGLNHAFELNNGTNVDVSLEVDVRKT